jgi:tRNA A-37 threonylcarbamoyl transferase component Bud32
MKACPQCKMRYPNEATYCFVDGTTLEGLEDPRLGKAIAGRYMLEEVLGEGGMATVYRGRHRLTEQLFAIKVMNPALARDPIVRERFRREAKNAQKLAHPNIIEIFEQGDTEDGTAYMVMEFLDGASLADLVAKGPLPIDRALGIMIQCARALARAHDFEVIHRDLKPENIFVCKRADGSDLVKLLDFGIARSMHDSRLTGTGELFGTPQYMAPERITSTDAGPSADLYALGIIFFEMLTGRLPFDAPDIASFFVKHLKEKPLPIRELRPDAPEALCALIDRLMAKDPAARPVDAHRTVLDLVAIAAEVGAPIPPDPVADPASLRPPSMPISDDGAGRWTRRVAVFRQMLARAFPLGAPAPMRQLVDDIAEMAERVGTLRRRCMEEQANVEDVAQRGREGRQRFGLAVDALGADAMRAREEARAAVEALRLRELKAELVKEKFAESHKEILFWEGRSAMQVPYKELAEAYRAAAATMDQWVAAFAEIDAAKKRKAAAETLVCDLEFQIQQLRAALVTHEQDIEAERAAIEAAVTDMAREADALEDDLVQKATAFCEPLRQKPELGPLFQALEAA